MNRLKELWTRKSTPTVALVCGASLLELITVLPNLSDHFLGFEMVDYYGTLWFYWWVDHQMAAGESLHHADVFFHPWGKDLFGHTGSNILDAVAAVPFRRLLGPVLGYNVFLLGCMGLSTVAFYQFAQRFFSDRWALAVSVFAFHFMPYSISEMAEGRPTQSILLLPVLFVWMMWRTGETRALKYPLAAGVLLAATGYQYWYYALFGGLNCLAYGLYRTARPPEGAGPGWQVLGRFALVAGVALLCTAPFAWGLLTAEAGDVPGLLRTDRWTLAGVNTLTAEGFPVGLYTWQPLRWTAGFLIFRGNGDEFFMPTYPMLPWIAVPYLWWFFRNGVPQLDRGPMAAAMLLCLVLVVGPVLIVWHYQIPNPLYIVFAQSAGFISRLWWAQRLWAFLGMWMALAVAGGVVWLRMQGGWRKRLAIPVVVLLWTADLNAMGHFPLGFWDATVPAGYRCLAAGERAPIIEIPYGGTQAHVYYQTVHERPIHGGMIEDNPVLAPAEITALHRSNSVLRFIRHGMAVMGRAPFWENRTPRATDLQRLYDMGYRYVVLQHEEYGELLPGQLTSQLEAILGEPIWDDARVSIYDPWDQGLPCYFSKPYPDDDTRIRGGEIDETRWNKWLTSADERVWRFGAEIPEPPPLEDTGAGATLDAPVVPGAP